MKSDYVEKRTYHAALIVCALVILGLVVIIFAGPKETVSRRQLDAAVADLENALDTIRSTEQYGGDEQYDDVCDSILDDVTDALAWLEADSS